MEMWTVFAVLLVVGAVLFFILKQMWKLGFKASIIAIVLVTVVFCVAFNFFISPIDPDTSFYIFSFVAVAFLFVQFTKMLTGMGVLPKILATVVGSVLVGGIAYATTGDFSVSTGGGIVLLGISIGSIFGD